MGVWCDIAANTPRRDTLLDRLRKTKITFSHRLSVVPSALLLELRWKVLPVRGTIADIPTKGWTSGTSTMSCMNVDTVNVQASGDVSSPLLVFVGQDHARSNCPTKRVRIRKVLMADFIGVDQHGVLGLVLVVRGLMRTAISAGLWNVALLESADAEQELMPRLPRVL